MNKSLAAVPLGLAGLASGTLYALWVTQGTGNFGKMGEAGGILDLVTHHAGAGIFYGVIVGAVLHQLLKFEAWRWALWIVGAGLSYAAAYNLAIKLYDMLGESTVMNYLSGGIAGAFGAALLCGVSAALFAPLRSARAVLLGSLAGGIVGLGLQLALSMPDQALPWILFFAIWQSAYAVASTRA